MFERFTERARQVVVLAQEESRLLKHNYIGTEHVLLGLLREQEGLAARALHDLGITVERVRAQVVRIVGSGEEVTSGQIPFTPRAKKVLELALREALSLGHNYIGTEHILLGLVRENEGVAARILLDFDADSEKIRNEVIRMLSGSGTDWRATVATPGDPPGRPIPARAWFGGTRDAIAEIETKIWQHLGRSPDSGDLLLVLACASETRAAAALRALGIELDALVTAIAAAREQIPVSEHDLGEELERVRREKLAAVSSEHYEAASELRDRERELVRTLAGLDPDPELTVALERRLGLSGPG